MSFRAKMVGMFAVGLVASTSALASAVIQLDDSVGWVQRGTTGRIANIGFEINFFGNTYSKFAASPDGVLHLTDRNILAHVDASYAYITPFSHFPQYNAEISMTLTYGNMVYNNHTAFTVNWVNDHYLSGATDPLRNSFQLVLVDRSDVGAGDFDFIFNFESIQWDTDTGSPSYPFGSFFGYGTSTPDWGTGFGVDEYGYSTNPYGFPVLDSSQLPYNSLNSDVAGRYIFEVRNGIVTNPLPLYAPFPGAFSGVITPLATTMPEPETWAMLLVGLGIVTGVARRRAK